MRPGLGQVVRLDTPENQRLNGAMAVVTKLEDWGAHVKTDASKLGKFRAAWHEMKAFETEDAPSPTIVNGNGKHHKPASITPTGDVCSNCGGCNLTRSGTCLVCRDCGTSGGC